jgi:hypothetical protein
MSSRSRVAMRALAVLFASIPLAHATIRPDWTQTPRSVAFSFESGDSVTFNLTHGQLRGIDFRVAGRLYSARLTGYPLLGQVQLDTVRFDSGPPGPNQGTFDLGFRAGAESARQFGELPQVGVAFLNGHLQDLATTWRMG